MQSSFQDIGLQAIKASDPWDMGGDKASPVFFQFTALREFPCHTVEKEHPGRALWTPQAEETAENPGSTGKSEFAGQSTREENAAQKENPRDIESPP